MTPGGWTTLLRSAQWADWTSLLSAWETTRLGHILKRGFCSAFLCPGCERWQIECDIERYGDDPHEWGWTDPDEVAHAAAAMREHLATCEPGAVMTALRGGQVNQ